MRVVRRALAGFAGLVMVAFLGVGGAAAPARSAPDPSTPGGPAAAGARTVTLPTGDTFLVSTDAAGHLLLASPAHVPALTQTVGGELYVTPLSARTPRGARYDVSALLRGGTDAAPPTAHPDFPMRTVTLNVTDEQGQPYSSGVRPGGLELVNLDDDRAYDNGGVAVVGGVAKVSVPDGHYGAILTSIAVTADGTPTSVRVAFSDFTVSGAPATAAVDLRTASHQVTFGTPKPADTLQNDIAYYLGSDETSGGAFATVGFPGSTALYVSDRPATAGVAHFLARLRAESPAGTARPYLYDLTFQNDGAFGGDRHYEADPATLATVDTRYHAGAAGTGLLGVFPIVPWLTGGFLSLFPVTEPLERTEYLSTAADLSYATQLLTSNDASGELWTGYSRAYRPGQLARVDWNQGPVGAGLPVPGDGLDGYLCPACRQDDTLEFILGPLTDSDPTHYGWLGGPQGDSTPSSHLQLFNGSTKLADVTDDRFPAVPVGPDPATYTLVYDVTRGTGPSSASHTEWTFASQHSGATTVPDRWYCGIESTRDDCSALDLVTLHYRLAQSLTGTVRTGAETLDVSVGHSTNLTAPAVTGASVSVSYDGGTTWTPAGVTARGAGRYTASWCNAASTAGKHVSVRVTASDAAGGTVTQTVTDAVTVVTR